MTLPTWLTTPTAWTTAPNPHSDLDFVDQDVIEDVRLLRKALRERDKLAAHMYVERGTTSIDRGVRKDQTYSVRWAASAEDVYRVLTEWR